MPGRPHHTDKMRSCVEDVTAKGHDQSSAYAICTASLQKAGEPIFVGAEAGGEDELRLLSEFAQVESLRTLHLVGSTGEVRKALHQGREHLVVPVVALMEGVIHAVNAATPEFVPASSLAVSPHSWNGRPLVLGHPTKNGVQISANDPAVLDKQGFGFIAQSRFATGKKLGMEAWIDPTRLEAIGQQKMLEDIRAGKPIEVSVGAYVTTNGKAGSFNGKPYKAEWVGIQPDHLAFLPNGRGACSLEMGCGSGRIAQLMTAEGFVEVIDKDPTVEPKSNEPEAKEPEPEVLGDKPGHEFHGNQYTDAGGGGEESAQNAHMREKAGLGPDRKYVAADPPIGTRVAIADGPNKGVTGKVILNSAFGVGDRTTKTVIRDAHGTTYAVHRSSLSDMHPESGLPMAVHDRIKATASDEYQTIGHDMGWDRKPPSDDEFTSVIRDRLRDTLSDSDLKAWDTMSSKQRDALVLKVMEAGEELETLGDKPGHEFHGNQWTEHAAGSPTHDLATKGAQVRRQGDENSPATQRMRQVTAVHDVGKQTHVQYADGQHATFKKGAKDLSPSNRNPDFQGYPLQGQKNAVGGPEGPPAAKAAGEERSRATAQELLRSRLSKEDSELHNDLPVHQLFGVTRAVQRHIDKVGEPKSIKLEHVKTGQGRVIVHADKHSYNVGPQGKITTLEDAEIEPRSLRERIKAMLPSLRTADKDEHGYGSYKRGHSAPGDPNHSSRKHIDAHASAAASEAKRKIELIRKSVSEPGYRSKPDSSLADRIGAEAFNFGHETVGAALGLPKPPVEATPKAYHTSYHEGSKAYGKWAAEKLGGKLPKFEALSQAELEALGDVPGHEFHGNQFTSGSAAGKAHLRRAAKILGRANVDRETGHGRWSKDGGHPNHRIWQIHDNLIKHGYKEVKSESTWHPVDNVTHGKTYAHKNGSTATMDRYYGNTAADNHFTVRITPPESKAKHLEERDDMRAAENPNHEPAGSPGGGQFASGEAGSGAKESANAERATNRAHMLSKTHKEHASEHTKAAEAHKKAAVANRAEADNDEKQQKLSDASIKRDNADFHDRQAAYHEKVAAGGKASKSSPLDKEHRRTLEAADESELLTADAAEEQAELIAYQSMRDSLDAISAQLASATSHVDAMIAAETDDPAESDDDEAAEEEIEGAQLEAISSLCMQMMGGIGAVMGVCRQELMDDDDSPGVVTMAARACEDCGKTGTLDGKPCKACQGTGTLEMKAAAGRRNSAADQDVIQKVHDHAKHLGADCDAQNTPFMKARMAEDVAPQKPTAAAPTPGALTAAERADIITALTNCKCGKFTSDDLEMLSAASDERLVELRAAADTDQQGDSTMKFTPEEKAAVIKTLVANSHSGFVAGDEKMLEAATDDRLESFRVAADARKVEVDGLKAAAAKELTTEEFMKVAPADLKALLERQRASETKYKVDLVAELKTAQSEYSESELAAKPVDELERLARIARVQLRPDFSGRGVILTRAAEDKDVHLNPPDPYKAGIERMRAAAAK